MAGESMISVGNIEQRAEDLEKKQAEEAAAAAAKKPEGETEEKVETGSEPEVKDEKKPVVKDEKTGKFVKKEESQQKPPEDNKELRKWATKLSMENAEIRKQMENLASMLTKQQKEKIDWKELAKDPAKLEKMVEKREQELIAAHQSEYQKNMEQAAADLTREISDNRFKDAENFPRWAELMPLMKKLSDPNAPDTRINFNQHPKLVLDSLYELAQEIAEGDPNYKKPEPKKEAPVTGKTYSQEEYEAAVAKAKEEALAEHDKGLKQEMKGASVSGMSKGA